MAFLALVRWPLRRALPAQLRAVFLSVPATRSSLVVVEFLSQLEHLVMVTVLMYLFLLVNYPEPELDDPPVQCASRLLELSRTASFLVMF